MNLPYDKTNPISIEKYAQKLQGKKFREVLEGYHFNRVAKETTITYSEDFSLKEKIAYYNNPRGKGSLGNLLEEYYFHYKPNSDSNPDFLEAGTELKVTPFEKKKDGSLRAGERLVITMIPNDRPVEPVFEKSHVIEKLRLILLILYLREKDMLRTEFRIEYTKLFSILAENCKEDFFVIKEDYEHIIKKIQQGLAHELSEGDTRYLGACTKGSTAERSTQKQYYSDIPAKRRAYSLKQSYMTYVINHYIVGNIDTYDSFLKNSSIGKESFDSIVLAKLNKYKGYTEEQLYSRFEINSKSKQANSSLVSKILGVKTDNVEEFEKANIEIKTIRINKNGKPRESMSFPKFKILDFVKETFDTSELYEYFYEKRFLLVVFKENNLGKYELIGAKFWNMPLKDLEGVGKVEWEKYQKQFLKGINFEIRENKIKNNLLKSKDTKIFHLRPHAQRSAYFIDGKRYGNGTDGDMDELPNGDKMTKQCFWLNKEYILSEIVDILEGE